MLDVGTYSARARSWALGETSGGKEQVAVEFETLDSEGTPGPRITWYGYFTEKTLESTIKALRACGWTGDDMSDLQGLDANEVHIVVEHEQKDDGKTYARVRWVNPPGGLALKAQLPADKAKAFAARMRGQIAAIDRSAGTKRVPQATSRRTVIPPEPPPADPHEMEQQYGRGQTDDIPF